MKLLLFILTTLILVGCQSLQPVDVSLTPAMGTTPAQDPDDAALAVITRKVYEDTEFDWAPLFQLEDDNQHTRTRLLGPFIEMKQDADGRLTNACRPLFSRYEDFSREHMSQDILYPFLSYRLNAIRLLQNGFIGISIDDNIFDEESPWQDYILPFYFNGRGREGDRYFAIWPLGGEIRDVFSYKYIQFWLWPLYMKTVKSNDIISYHALWPIFHQADGPFVKKRKVFPLMGYADDYKRGWRSSFCMWPLVHWGYSLDQESRPGWACGLFPLGSYTTLDIPERDFSFYSWNFLFPFFMHAVSNDAIKIHAPWPFFQYSKENDKNGNLVGARLWFWPLWGKDLKRGSDELFVLYPLYFKYDRPIPDGRRKMSYFFVAFMHTEDKKNNGDWARFTRIWPLASYERDSKGAKSLKILDIFPLRHVYAVERNWSPIWTLYEYNATNEQVSHEMLWGMFQFKKRRDGDILDCSIFPLFNYEISGVNNVEKFSLFLGLYGNKEFPDGTEDSRYAWLWSHRSKGGKILRHGLFPFYDYGKTEDNQPEKFSLLTGLYSRTHTPKGVTKSRYGWLVTKETQAGKTIGHGVFPLYSKHHTLDGNAGEFNLLGGLWGKQTKNDGSRNTRLFWFFRINH